MLLNEITRRNYPTDKATIDKLCKTYDITNYTINPDWSLDVNGNVNLYKKNLIILPLRFRNVTGDFNCSYNDLTSLEGCPQIVTGSFSCQNNNLTSLVGGPKETGDFYCNGNKLTSLIGCPKETGWFDCSHNQITSLKGCPEKTGNFYCNDNPNLSFFEMRYLLYSKTRQAKLQLSLRNQTRYLLIIKKGILNRPSAITELKKLDEEKLNTKLYR